MKKAREKGADGVIVVDFNHLVAVTHDLDHETGDIDSDVTQKRMLQALAIKYQL